MKLAIPAIPLVALAASLVSGCAMEKKASPTSVMDVGPSGAQTGSPGYEPAGPVGRPMVPSAPAATPFRGVSSSELRSASSGARAVAPILAADVRHADSSETDTRSTTPTDSEPLADSLKVYVVKKGDTLSAIARAQYGDAGKWKRLVEANPGINAKSLRIGQKLNVPNG